MPVIAGYLTAKEAAEKIGVSYEQVTRYLNSGRLKGCRVGREWLVAESAVDKFERPPRGNPNLIKSA